MPEHTLRNDMKREFTSFIQEFRDPNGELKYELAAKNALNNTRHTIMFGFRDLMHHNSELASLIFAEYYKY